MWIKFMPVLAGFVVGAALAGWLGHILLVNRTDEDARAQVVAVDAQKAADATQCTKDKTTTKEANDALQIDLNDIRRKRDAERVHPARCLPVAPAPRVAVAATRESGEHAGQNEFCPIVLNSEWLHDFAAECETYRSEVIILTHFKESLEQNHAR